MKVKFTTNIDKKLLEKIKIKAIQDGRNVNEIIENLLEEYLKGEIEMTNLRNQLTEKNLMNTYYDNGLYELEFDINGKQIFIRNIREEEHPEAKNDEWYFDNDQIISEIIKNAEDEDIEIEGDTMTNLEGKKVKDLSKEEREYLESIISGDYRGPDDKLEIGKNEVIIDFENGLSVAGWIINTEDEMVYELDEEGIIYDPSK